MKEAQKQCENDAISGEIERIQRTLKMVGEENFNPTNIEPASQHEHSQSSKHEPKEEVLGLDPELKAQQEIESNNKEIEDIERQLNSIK